MTFPERHGDGTPEDDDDDGGRPGNFDAAHDYEALFHTAPSGYLVTRPDGTVLNVNETLAGWLGRPRGGLIGSNVMDWMPTGDRVVFASYAQAQLGVSGRFTELATVLVGDNGARLPMLVSGFRSGTGDRGDRGTAVDRLTFFSAPLRTRHEQELAAALQKAGAAEAARTSAENRLLEKQRALEEKDRTLEESLSQSRHREALLETVLNTADVGLLVVDGEGKPLLMNSRLDAASRRIVGTAGSMELAAHEVFRADRITPLLPEKRPVPRAAAGESFSNEVVWLGTGEDQMAVSVSARPVLECGKVTGSVLSFSDVTRLVHAAAAQDDFVANVSHELRTPLTSIMGYLDLALDAQELPEQVSESLTVALRNAERLLGLVSDLLSVASGSRKLDRKRIDVAEVVRAGVLAAAPYAAAGGVEISVDIPGAVPAEVDPRRMGQVVDNLLSNAVKYSPGGGDILVRLRSEGQSIILEVEDTGMGMSKAEQEQVFTKFFRSRRAITSAVPGAGLGLVITRNIVELHGGTLTFRSSLGKGSVFTAVLPDDGATS